MEYIYLATIAALFVLTCRLTAFVHHVRVERSKRIQRFYTARKLES